MCTVIKRQADNLKFLEDTRQHMSRLPSIDPDTRTIILCGFPNVGKSSFINKVDIKPFEALSEEDKQSINSIVQWHTDRQIRDPDRPIFVEMSTVTEVGLVTVRSVACDDLLAQRVQAKIRAAALPGSNVDISNRLYIAKPKPDGNKVMSYFFCR
uniref:Nucleolar GTP-binding protein 1 n=1 Tax=Schistosoma haematobium TaxID=6185 RepID=A0A095A6R2_SCHHA